MQVKTMEDEDLRKWKSYWHWIYYAIKSFLWSSSLKDAIESVVGICFLLLIIAATLLPIVSVFILWDVLVMGASMTLKKQVVVTGAVICPPSATYIYYKLSRRQALN